MITDVLGGSWRERTAALLAIGLIVLAAFLWGPAACLAIIAANLIGDYEGWHRALRLSSQRR